MWRFPLVASTSDQLGLYYWEFRLTCDEFPKFSLYSHHTEQNERNTRMFILRYMKGSCREITQDTIQIQQVLGTTNEIQGKSS
jgi:hypothetical protein